MAVLTRRSSRHKALWEKSQARREEEEKVAEEEAARVALRVARLAEKEWEVEKIMQKREWGGVLHYRVKWKGYSSHRNTWETAENLQGARRAIAIFEKKFKNKK